MVFCYGLTVQNSDTVDKVTGVGRAAWVTCNQGYEVAAGVDGYWVSCLLENVWFGVQTCKGKYDVPIIKCYVY